jgi:tetratricopeptide (TPR) repeat protein
MPLAEGDVLTLGDTRLAFHRPSQTLPIPPNRRQRRAFRRAAAATALLGAVALGAATVRATRNSARKHEEAARAQERLAAIFQDGKRLVRRGNWEQALQKFERLRAESPDFPGLAEYIDRAAQEVPNEKLLASARASLEENDLGAAREALAKVDADSQLHSQLQEAKDLLGERVALRLGDARRAFSERDFPRALELAQEVLKAAPDNADAEAFANRAKDAMAGRRKPPVRATAARMQQAATSLFRDGDLDSAIATAETCAARNLDPCDHLLKEMREFAGLHTQVEDLDLKGLERLLELAHRAAGGKPSSLMTRAMARAAAIYYKEASAAKIAAQWPKAMELAARALQLAPDHPGAQAIVSDLRARAKELFVFAYSVKDTAPDEAIIRFKEVMALTPANDETHRKAVNWVEKLSR